MSGFRVTFPGPFSHHEVVFDGWTVPFLEAHLHGENDESITLIVDNRFGETFTVEEAERIIPILAHAVAIALGFTCHPNEETESPLVRHPHPRPVRMNMIIGANTDEVDAS